MTSSKWPCRQASIVLLMASVLQLCYGAVPVLTPFSSPVNLPEDTTAETRLRRVVCTDADAGDACLCNLGSTTPENGPFQVWKKDGLADFYVYYIGVNNGAALSFSTTPSWQVQVSCTDTTVSAAQTTNLEIDIQPNRSPVFTNTNFPRETLTLNAKQPYVAGTTVYTVTATDAEDDSLSFSITSSPNVGYFVIGASDGNINTAIDLRAASESIITLTVSVTDGQNVVTGFDVVITLTNLNQAPDITNLPATITLNEDTANGHIITTLTISDPDIFVASLDPTCTVTPTAEDYKFVYETGTRRIRTATLAAGATLLDFELTSQYIITCVLNDGFRTSSEVLTINIDNVNEAPTFDEIAYYCDMLESNSGVSSCDIKAVITDPEGDTITSISFMAGNNSERFRYDRSTTTITFNVDYDVDANNMPTSVILQLSAVDSNGLAGRVPVYFTISDANDNTCNFGATSALRVSADQGTALGNIGTFIATDSDLRAPNNVLTYELISTSPADALNYINVFSDGRVEYTSLIPETNHGTSYSLTVRCKDGGSPSLTSQATFILSYTTTTTTSTTTTTTAATTTASSSDDPFSNDGFLAVFIILMVLLAFGLLILLYFCLKACGLFGGLGGAGAMGAAGAGGSSGGFSGICNQCCMPREPPQQKVRPYEPQEVYQPERINDMYAEKSWKTGDHFEDGRGSRGSAVVTILGGHRALPAPRNYHY